MKPDEQVDAVFHLLKRHLRDRRTPYREIARRIPMSESNLKRIFASRTCTFDRLTQICAAAETSLVDLLLAAGRSEQRKYRLSPEAERYFVENFDAFIFYRRCGLAPDLTAFLKTCGVGAEKLRARLRQFEKMGLLNMSRSGWRLRHSGYLQIPPESPLRKKLEQEWVPWFFQRLLARTGEAGFDLQMFSTGLTEAHFAELKSDLKKLGDKYRELGLTDQRLGKREFRSVGVCIGIGPYRIGHFEDH